MKIYTFGCSWTYGCKGEEELCTAPSWVEELAKKYPDIEFEDYSYPGTCIEYSLFLMNQVLNKKSTDDKIVFQFTMPYRYTTWRDSGVFLDEENRYNKLTNYSKFVDNMYDHLERHICNIQSMNSSFGKLDLVFHNKYYAKLNEKKELSSYYAITEYVKQKADFVFFHRDYNKFISATGRTLTLSDYDFSPSIEAILGNKLFQSYAWDISKHFNKEGCKHVADIVATNIGLKHEN